MNPILISILNSTNEMTPSIEKFEQGLPLKYDHAVDIISYCEENRIKIVTFLDENYPKKLLNDKTNPSLIFYKGRLDLIDTKCLGVVGSRAIDEYVVYQVKSAINRSDNTIVSGLAYGTDILAHSEALKHDKDCIGVLPCGLNPEVFYPKTNYKYSYQIEEKGLVISMFLPNCKPKPYFFVLRNKFLVAISDTIWIVKASVGSGTMTTANYTLESKKLLIVSPASLRETEYLGNLECIAKGGEILTSLDYFGEEKMQFIPSIKQSRILEDIKQGYNTIDLLMDNHEYIILLEELEQLVEAGVVTFHAGVYN